LALRVRLYHAGLMAHVESDKADQQWRHQELALFARRAHRKVGRDFVAIRINYRPLLSSRAGVPSDRRYET
jgi:hypothetical protein